MPRRSTIRRLQAARISRRPCRRGWRAHVVDIVALAGFMRLMTAAFVESWTGCMINIHPALLPSFPGLATHERALEAGVRIHGCTVHYVTPGMDEGPIIAQAAVPVLSGDSADVLGASRAAGRTQALSARSRQGRPRRGACYRRQGRSRRWRPVDFGIAARAEIQHSDQRSGWDPSAIDPRVAPHSLPNLEIGEKRLCMSSNAVD